jgi:hypothetical protein
MMVSAKEDGMSWEIKVWHEDVGDRARLSIEADGQVPDDVISAVAGSYWFEEVQLAGEEWDDAEAFADTGDTPAGRLQG